jgi:hypothetical protein
VTPAPERPPRWMLNRAGIINVYQYGDETLDFAGGRLLLRGVNGSGKSTAMNMLLPFLLDADTRRIDAAGEQSGVLRAWMLSGRDEPQPQGYLWLEVSKNDSYLNFGCGIRANRATDQVTTWWFITSHRVGLDLNLVEGRVPISREAPTRNSPSMATTRDLRAVVRRRRAQCRRAVWSCPSLFGPRAAERITRPAHQSGSLITRLPDTNTTEEAATAPRPIESVSLVQVAVPVDTEKIVFLFTS